MKKSLFCALAFAPFAHADPLADPHVCSLLGSVYETAAHARDTRNSPETALRMVAPYKDVPIEWRKLAINQVYFDDRFAAAGGPALEMQVVQACMSGPTNYRPLK